MMSTLTAHGQWELGRLDGEGENWPPSSYVEAKKMKSLTLHPHGCPRAAKDYSSFILLILYNKRTVVIISKALA